MVITRFGQLAGPITYKAQKLAGPQAVSMQTQVSHDGNTYQVQGLRTTDGVSFEKMSFVLQSQNGDEQVEIRIHDDFNGYWVGVKDQKAGIPEVRIPMKSLYKGWRQVNERQPEWAELRKRKHLAGSPERYQLLRGLIQDTLRIKEIFLRDFRYANFERMNRLQASTQPDTGYILPENPLTHDYGDDVTGRDVLKAMKDLKSDKQAITHGRIARKLGKHSFSSAVFQDLADARWIRINQQPSRPQHFSLTE